MVDMFGARSSILYHFQGVIMKKSRTLLCWITWLWFFCFICFSADLSHAAKIEQDTWSFDFKNCSVSDALTHIIETTGIYVFTNKPINKKLCRSYDAGTIDQILKDIFRKENHVMIWYYSENKLDSVDIRIFESSGSDNNFHQSRPFRKTSAKGGVTRKKVAYKSVSSKGQSGSDNLKNRASRSEATSNDNPETGVHDGNIETTDKNTVSPPPVPDKRLGLEPPPMMPPGFKN